MTADDFALAVGLLFGDVSPTAGAAIALGVSKANIQRWASGTELPPGIADEVVAMLRARRMAIDALLEEIARRNS